MIRAFGCAPRSLNDNRHISDDSRETLCKTYPVNQWDTTSWIYVVLFAILKTKNSITISEMFFSWKNIATKPLLNLQLMIFAVLRAAFQLSPSSAPSPCQGLLPEKKQFKILLWIDWSGDLMLILELRYECSTPTSQELEWHHLSLSVFQWVSETSVSPEKISTSSILLSYTDPVHSFTTS